MSAVTADELRRIANEEERAANARLRAIYEEYDARLKRWAVIDLLWTLALMIATLLLVAR